MPARCRFALLAILSLAVLSPPLQAADLGELTKLFRSGEYARCVADTTAEIEKAQYSEQLRLLKLRAEMELGRYGDALQTFDQALGDFPDSIQVRWLGRDVCRMNQQAERAGEAGSRDRGFAQVIGLEIQRRGQQARRRPIPIEPGRGSQGGAQQPVQRRAPQAAEQSRGLSRDRRARARQGRLPDGWRRLSAGGQARPAQSGTRTSASPRPSPRAIRRRRRPRSSWRSRGIRITCPAC